MSWTASSPRRGAPALVAGLTVIGLALRLPSWHDSLFGDELSAFYIVAGNSFGRMMHQLNGHSTELNPPLFFILAWLSVKLFGLSALSLKLVSLITGTATIPLLYLVGRRTTGTVPGLVAAACGAGCPFLIYYSTEARPYALMVFLVLVATLALLRAVQQGGRGWWLLYALAASAAAYTHFTAVFALVGLAVWALIACPDVRRCTLGASALAVLLYVPELPVLSRISRSPGTSLYGILDPLNLHAARTDLGHWAIGHPYESIAQVPGTPAAVLIVAGLAAGLLGIVLSTLARDRGAGGGGPRGGGFTRSRSHEPVGRGALVTLVVVLALAAPVGAALYTELHSSVWGARNVISSWPFLALAGATLVCVAPLPWRAGAVALVLAGFALGGISMLSSSHHRPDYDAAVAYLDRIDPRGGPIAEVPAPSPGPPTETEAAIDLAEVSRIHAVYRIGEASLAQVLSVAPYTPLPAPSGQSTARAVAAAAGHGALFVVAPTSVPIAALEALRARHLDSTSGTFGHFVTFLGALPARFVPVAARTFPGLLPVTVYVFRG